MDSNLHNHYSSHPQQQQIQQQLQHHHHHHNISSGMYGDEDVAPLFSPPVSRFSDVSSHRILGRIRGNESHFMNSKGIVHNNNNNNSMAPATNSLRRQSSSPAGFFENMDNGGYSVMGSVDKFGHVNGGVTHDSLLSSTNRLKMPMAFSTGLQSSSRLLSRIDEQNEGEIYGVTGLTHQLSLPTSSTELSAMENLLQFQDNVPLRSRAKRGCATHPRSIAERVRRTRISERMKKLQDLVPNMDKQTSISDMLDLAVDYIKNLQKEVETLADHHAKCRCPNKKKI